MLTLALALFASAHAAEIVPASSFPWVGSAASFAAANSATLGTIRAASFCAVELDSGTSIPCIGIESTLSGTRTLTVLVDRECDTSACVGGLPVFYRSGVKFQNASKATVSMWVPTTDPVSGLLEKLEGVITEVPNTDPPGTGPWEVNISNGFLLYYGPLYNQDWEFVMMQWALARLEDVLHDLYDVNGDADGDGFWNDHDYGPGGDDSDHDGDGIPTDLDLTPYPRW